MKILLDECVTKNLKKYLEEFEVFTVRELELCGIKNGKLMTYSVENKFHILLTPSNVILAEKFAEVFDGFSIGSNDLTQLTLGIDRDSAIISNLFEENNKAIKWMLQSVIEAAKKCKIKIALCGQARLIILNLLSFLLNWK